jgi:hypothetical protein
MNLTFPAADVIEHIRPIDDNRLIHILTQNALNWDVEKQRLFLPNGTQTDFFGVVRTDNHHTFQACTKQYHPLQNRELMQTALIISDLLEQPITKVKQMEDGAIVYITFEGRRHQINGLKVGDTVQEKLSLVNSHDGSKAFGLSFGHVVLSCLNGQTRFDRKGFFSIRHTASISEKIKAFSKALPYVLSESDRMIESYHRMIDRPITEREQQNVIQIMTDVKPTTVWEELSTKKQNILQDLHQSMTEEMSYKGQSAWGLLNGVTHYTTKNAETPQGLKSKLFGKTGMKELKVFEYLSSLN